MLSPYDYLVIGFYFVFMAAIGWICRKFIGNTSDYFRGGGKMLWWMAGWPCTTGSSPRNSRTGAGAGLRSLAQQLQHRFQTEHIRVHPEAKY